MYDLVLIDICAKDGGEEVFTEADALRSYSESIMIL